MLKETNLMRLSGALTTSHNLPQQSCCLKSDVFSIGPPPGRKCSPLNQFLKYKDCLIFSIYLFVFIARMFGLRVQCPVHLWNDSETLNSGRLRPVRYFPRTYFELLGQKLRLGTFFFSPLLDYSKKGEMSQERLIFKPPTPCGVSYPPLCRLINQC